jgi:hypothetical protein
MFCGRINGWSAYTMSRIFQSSQDSASDYGTAKETDSDEEH